MKPDDTIDCLEQITWYKSTILLEREVRVADGRNIKEFLIAFRVYSDKGSKSDQKGKYEGLSEKYDKWVPAFSPRITHFYTKSQSRGYASEDLDI